MDHIGRSLYGLFLFGMDKGHNCLFYITFTDSYFLFENIKNHYFEKIVMQKLLYK